MSVANKSPPPIVNIPNLNGAIALYRTSIIYSVELRHGVIYMELVPIQREILLALISIYHKTHIAVKGAEIADLIDRNPGTVRNQMQALKTLRLVEGVPGPKGGYKATARAYEVMAIGSDDGDVHVPVHKDGELVDDLTVENFNFTTLRNPMTCRASIKLIGNIRDFKPSDKIEIGPTPVNNTIIRCEVEGRDDTQNVLLCTVLDMISLPTKPVKDYMDYGLVPIPANSSLQEASRLLLQNDVRCAPLMEKGKVVGITSFRDVCKALAKGDITSNIGDYARKDVISIEGDRPFSEALGIVGKHGIGSLLVTENGAPKGLITRTKILSELSARSA